MKVAKRKVDLVIMGSTYSFVSDESEAHLAQTARMVDDLMQGVMNASGSTDQHRVAVLCALRFASGNLKLEDSLDAYKATTSRLNDDVHKALSCTAPI
jgi:cell division protein ZapA (FtsZ GTPase activity inhibitor)